MSTTYEHLIGCGCDTCNRAITTATRYCSTAKAMVPMHTSTCDWCGEEHA